MTKHQLLVLAAVERQERATVDSIARELGIDDGEVERICAQLERSGLLRSRAVALASTARRLACPPRRRAPAVRKRSGPRRATAHAERPTRRLCS